MCGEYIPWPEHVTEMDRRRMYSEDPTASEWFERLTISGSPHGYPRNKSIGYRLLDLKAADATNLQSGFGLPRSTA